MKEVAPDCRSTLRTTSAQQGVPYCEADASATDAEQCKRAAVDICGRDYVTLVDLHPFGFAQDRCQKQQPTHV